MSENTHDPLCEAPKCQRCFGNFAYCISHICDCAVVVRVRADEREKAAQRVAALDAQRIMVTGADGLPRAEDYINRTDAVAAARGGA